MRVAFYHTLCWVPHQRVDRVPVMTSLLFPLSLSHTLSLHSFNTNSISFASKFFTRSPIHHSSNQIYPSKRSLLSQFPLSLHYLCSWNWTSGDERSVDHKYTAPSLQLLARRVPVEFHPTHGTMPLCPTRESEGA